MRFQIHLVLQRVHLYLRMVTNRQAKLLVVTSERTSRKEMLCKYVTVIIDLLSGIKCMFIYILKMTV